MCSNDGLAQPRIRNDGVVSKCRVRVWNNGLAFEMVGSRLELTGMNMVGQGDEVALGPHPHSHWLSMSTVVAWAVISACRRNWVRDGWVCIRGCKREGLGGSGTRSPAHVASGCVVVHGWCC